MSELNSLENGEIIPDSEILKDYRKIFYGMKKIFDHSYQYPYVGNANEIRSFTTHQQFQMVDSILIDKIVQNRDMLVDGTQGVGFSDQGMHTFISLSRVALYPEQNRTAIDPLISNFFMCHELSHIIYRKYAEKCSGYITSQNLNFLFRPDFELNMRPRTQNKEMLCDIIAIIILWVTSILEERSEGFNTIAGLIKYFRDLTIDSIRTSQVPEIIFFKQNLVGSTTHPLAVKRLLTIKFMVNKLEETRIRTFTPDNVNRLCYIGIDALNMFNKLNSNSNDYQTVRTGDGYIDYVPVAENPKWNLFNFNQQGGNRKKITKNKSKSKHSYKKSKKSKKTKRSNKH